MRLSLTDDYDDVHYYILEAFPKLKEAGGYELLRASNVIKEWRECLWTTPMEMRNGQHIRDIVKNFIRQHSQQLVDV